MLANPIRKEEHGLDIQLGFVLGFHQKLAICCNPIHHDMCTGGPDQDNGYGERLISVSLVQVEDQNCTHLPVNQLCHLHPRERRAAS